MLLLSACLFLLLSSCATKQESQTEEPLPVLSLLSEQDTAYTKKWQKGQLIVEGDTLTLKYKGRGHSTFDKPKHPYTLRFKQKQSMLGIKPQRHWVLLAGFFDHSLIRNALAFEVARQTSLDSITPQGRFVTLNVDGVGQGVYYLCERPKDMTSDSLILLDAYEAAQRQEKGKLPKVLPDLPIDTLSFIDWFLINELCMNAEPNGPRSCYFHVSPDGILHAGPVWDFDMAFNPVGVDDGGDLRPDKFRTMKQLPPFLQGKTIRWLNTDSLYNDQTLCFGQLLKDSRFCRNVAQRWQELRPRFAGLTAFIDSLDQHIRPEAITDQQQWNALEPARFDSCKTYQTAIETLKERYLQRLETLDRLLKSFD